MSSWTLKIVCLRFADWQMGSIFMIMNSTSGYLTLRSAISPVWSVASMLSMQLVKMMTTFGLTGSLSRSSVTLPVTASR